MEQKQQLLQQNIISQEQSQAHQGAKPNSQQDNQLNYAGDEDNQDGFSSSANFNPKGGHQQLIDLESEDLSYNQAKKIRLQVERDVELLRNRVKMLQLEEEKALKKINETKKKTKQILDLKNKNDQKYQNQIQQSQNNQGSLKYNQTSNYEKRQKQMDDIKKKQQKLQQLKAKEVQSVKSMIQNHMSYKQQLLNQQEQLAEEKRQFMKAQREIAEFKKQQFQKKKISSTKKDQVKKLEEERNDIKSYEIEAQELEMLEAELLRKLQETQQVEREAFNKLETAMIDASLPKKVRVGGVNGGGLGGGNQSQFSDRSGTRKSNNDIVVGSPYQDQK